MSRNATSSVSPPSVKASSLLSFPAASAIFACTAAMLLTGCQKQEAAAKKLPVMVRTETVAIANFAPRTSLTGVIAARTLNNLSFRVGGRVAERLVDVGQHVDQGTVLARIDPQEQESDLRSAQADLDAAQAQLTQSAAAFERQMAETEISATARQWAVRKLAALLLGGAIEKHRESQADPLLLRASALFRTLTSGSFDRLSQDYGADDQPRLVGVRRNNERVPIPGMSEGTRDQLYLSLRLAYIEDYADRAESVPFIGDDIFQTFDDERTAAGISALAAGAGAFQPILFTHHLSVVAIARKVLGPDLDYIEL